MTRARAHASHRAIGAFLHRWHRRLGAAVCLFVIWLAASGWALNHTEALQLQAIEISAPWLTRWYGLRAPEPEKGFNAANHWLIGTDGAPILDGRRLETSLPAPLGLVATGQFLFAANRDSLLVLGNNGQSVDALRPDDLGLSEIARIGSVAAEVVVADPRGKAFASQDGVSWQTYSGQIVWSVASVLPVGVRERAQAALRPRLSLERIVLDTHSGRILGRYGPFVVDLIGLVFVALAASGLWMFSRQRSHDSHRRPRTHVNKPLALSHDCDHNSYSE